MKTFCICFFLFLGVIPVAFSGKVELSAHAPSPYGEYTNLKSIADSYFATDSGGVCIGTTTSTLNKLRVTNSTGQTSNSYFTTNDFVVSTTGSALLLDFGATSGNTYTRLSGLSAGGSAWNNLILQSAGGKVGIGTTSPVGVLDVRGSLASLAWTAVSFGTGWSNYGSGYQAVQYKKFGDFVYLRGLANSGSNAWASYPTITTLPVGYRPAARLIFCQQGNANAAVRVDVTSTGTVVWAAGGAGSNWLSLDGIFFSVD